MIEKKLNFFAIFKLRCLYCNRQKLLKHGSWFSFAEGCKDCNYKYEREVGYFTGASWMICFPLVATIAFVLAALMMVITTWNLTLIISISSILSLALSLLSMPYCMALWMYIEHSFEPLKTEDQLVTK